MADIELRRITDLEDPALRPYRTMKHQHEHWMQGLFVAEGEKVVSRLIEAIDLELVSVLLPERWIASHLPRVQARPEPRLVVHTADAALLRQLTGFPLYQGLLAVARVPPAVSLQTLLARVPRPRLLVAADGLSGPDNLGVLVRNAAGFGAGGLILGETCAPVFLRRSVRNSMGAVFRLPRAEPQDLVEALVSLRAQGVRVVAAHPHTRDARLSGASLTGDCCIVLGSEGEGIRPSVLDVCDEQVAVPMQNGIDSLNVGSASAVFLYEVARQRGLA